jgi:hypothetical protein
MVGRCVSIPVRSSNSNCTATADCTAHSMSKCQVVMCQLAWMQHRLEVGCPFPEWRVTAMSSMGTVAASAFHWSNLDACHFRRQCRASPQRRLRAPRGRQQIPRFHYYPDPANALAVRKTLAPAVAVRWNNSSPQGVTSIFGAHDEAASAHPLPNVSSLRSSCHGPRFLVP